MSSVDGLLLFYYIVCFHMSMVHSHHSDKICFGQERLCFIIKQVLMFGRLDVEMWGFLVRNDGSNL